MGVIEAAMRADLAKLIAEQQRTNQLLEHVAQLLARYLTQAPVEPRQWHPPAPPWQETGVPR